MEMNQNTDQQYKCEHCSRRSYQGHHPDCPNHPDKQPKPVTITQAQYDELRAAWDGVPESGIVPDGFAKWLQPLINAVTAIVAPDHKAPEQLPASQALPEQLMSALEHDVDEQRATAVTDVPVQAAEQGLPRAAVEDMLQKLELPHHPADDKE